MGREVPGPLKGADMRAILQHRVVKVSGLVLALGIAWLVAGAPIWGAFPG